MPERGHRRWVSVLPVSATPDTSMQSASACTRVTLRAVKGGKITLTVRFVEQKAPVCEGRWRPACPIMSPGRPAANPHMHSGRNSNNPKSSSMEFHRAGGRQINHRLWEAADRKQGTGKDSSRECSTEGREGREGSRERFENNSSRSWQVVRYSTLPKMAAPLGYSC